VKNAKRSHPTPWTPEAAEVSVAADASEGRARYQPAVTRRSRQVRVLVAVLVALVVVLAILGELCLLQAAAMRRKVRAVLPPEEDEDR
jgi:hypothetical protein